MLYYYKSQKIYVIDIILTTFLIKSSWLLYLSVGVCQKYFRVGN
jgi:hypothetical protein